MSNPKYPPPRFLTTHSLSAKPVSTIDGKPAGEKVNLLDFSQEVPAPPAPSRPLERLSIWKPEDFAEVLLVSLQGTQISRHWIDVEESPRRRLVRCNGADCVVCATLNPRLDEVLLLPVWDLLSEVGTVLEIPLGAMHTGALQPQVVAVAAVAHAQHLPLRITCLDKGRYSVSLEDPLQQADAERLAGQFALAWELGEVDVASVIPQLDNATMVALSKPVRNLLTRFHPEHPALKANPLKWPR